MSTRALYTFTDGDGTFHVYKHCDGYPSGAAQFIEAAKAKAWILPRFDAAEFAAAFVAANKPDGGDVYLSKGPTAHGDLEYRYKVSMVRGTLSVKAQSTGGVAWRTVYRGPQVDFASWAEANGK